MLPTILHANFIFTPYFLDTSTCKRYILIMEDVISSHKLAQQ